jgi:Protein of unknown function (DUF3485)
MKPNVWLLPLVLGVSLGMIYFLPKAGKTAQSAIRMDLPRAVSDWVLEVTPPSKEEIGTLGKETDFSKAHCVRVRPGEFNAEGYRIPDILDLSIVLSGSDLNTSIHRPERCMPAQGHVITGSQPVVFTSPDGREFKAKRLRSVKRVKDPASGEVTGEYNCVTYYFFVGHERITNDHFERTLIDMKDRLVKGLDQRWAYFSVSMMYGKVPWIENEVGEAEADEKLRAFINDFAGKQIAWDQVES